MMLHKIKRIEMGVNDTAVYFLTNGDYVIKTDNEYKLFLNPRDENAKMPKIKLEPCFDNLTGFMIGFVEV